MHITRRHALAGPGLARLRSMSKDLAALGTVAAQAQLAWPNRSMAAAMRPGGTA